MCLIAALRREIVKMSNARIKFLHAALISEIYLRNGFKSSAICETRKSIFCHIYNDCKGVSQDDISNSAGILIAR